jgi:hypothetical protein
VGYASFSLMFVREADGWSLVLFRRYTWSRLLLNMLWFVALGLCALATSIVFAAVFGRRISNPSNQLAAAVSGIGTSATPSP